MKYYTRFPAPFWEIILAGDNAGLSNLHMITGTGSRDVTIPTTWKRNDSYFSDLKKQILAYFDGKQKIFNVVLNPQGTDFQKRVWKALATIPFGETRSYGDIAAAIGNPRASRAVGGANARNPIPLIVPCHRVIGRNGKLTGFAGGLAAKEQLLRLEGVL